MKKCPFERFKTGNCISYNQDLNHKEYRPSMEADVTNKELNSRSLVTCLKHKGVRSYEDD